MGFLHDLYRDAPKGQHRKSPFIVGDKAPYVSPMSRSVVEGRTAHREHMKQHGVVEAGDMKFGERTPEVEPKGVREDIQRAIQETNR